MENRGLHMLSTRRVTGGHSHRSPQGHYIKLIRLLSQGFIPSLFSFDYSPPSYFLPSSFSINLQCLKVEITTATAPGTPTVVVALTAKGTTIAVAPVTTAHPDITILTRTAAIITATLTVLAIITMGMDLPRTLPLVDKPPQRALKHRIY
ncbi:hypothetical protein C8Q75DRAFT_890283 [Abortiporus biennis]|nr:hypothetical protein C8Q75DRAFT_890283 [Abortiporus biennis]